MPFTSRKLWEAPEKLGQRVWFGNKEIRAQHGRKEWWESRVAACSGTGGVQAVVQLLRREKQSWKIYRIAPEYDSEGSFHPGSRLMEYSPFELQFEVTSGASWGHILRPGLEQIFCSALGWQEGSVPGAGWGGAAEAQLPADHSRSHNCLCSVTFFTPKTSTGCLW